jgi:hypothetical protein
MRLPAQLPDQFAQVVDLFLNDATCFRLTLRLGADGYFVLIFLRLFHALPWQAVQRSR